MTEVKAAPMTLPRRLLADAIGRIFTDTFAGIGPGSVPLYIGAQIVGAAIGLGLVIALFPHHSAAEPEVVSHPSTVPAIQET